MKRHFRSYILITGLSCVAAVLLVAGVWAYLVAIRPVLKAGARVTYGAPDLVEDSQYKVQRIPGDDSSVTGYYYSVVQMPGAVTSGRTATFKVTVTKGGQPIANRQFRAGVGHAYGIFTPMRSSDQSEGTYTTDAQGTFVFAYTAHFFAWFPDGAFNFHVIPILNSQEEADKAAREASGKLAAGALYGKSFIFIVYPVWTNWLLGR